MRLVSFVVDVCSSLYIGVNFAVDSILSAQTLGLGSSDYACRPW